MSPSQCSDASKNKKIVFPTKFRLHSFHYKHEFFVEILLNLTSYIKCKVLFLLKLSTFFVVKSISISCINFPFSNDFSFEDRILTKKIIINQKNSWFCILFLVFWRYFLMNSAIKNNILLSFDKSKFLHLKSFFFMKNNLKHTSFFVL